MTAVLSRQQYPPERKNGFIVYGTRPHGMKYPDGSYDNDYLMVKML